MNPIAIKILLTIPTILVIILGIVMLKNKNSDSNNLVIKALAVALIIASVYWGISLWV